MASPLTWPELVKTQWSIEERSNDFDARERDEPSRGGSGFGGADIIDLKDPAKGAQILGLLRTLSEAILLNTRGSIACASVANGFAVREGRLETPPVSDGASPATMRALVLLLAKNLGLVAVEHSLNVEDLAA